MKKYGFWGTLWRQLCLIKEAKLLRIYVMYFVYAIFNGVIPVIGVFFSKYIIDVIQHNTSEARLIWTVVVLVGASIICFIISSVADAVLSPNFTALRVKEFIKVSNFYQKIDYEHIEDSKFRDEMENAIEALNSDGRGFQHTYASIKSIFSKIVSIILFCIILCLFSPWIAIVCVLSTVVLSLINQRVINYIKKRQTDRSHASRQRYYFNVTCSDFAYGKDIRVFALKDSLLEKYEEKSDRLISITKAVENKSFKYSFFNVLALLIQNALSYYLIINAYFNQSIGLAEVSLYLSTIVAFSIVLREFSDHVTRMTSDVKLTISYFNTMASKDVLLVEGSREKFSTTSEIEIVFENVSFKYPNTERYILKDFNFTIKPGEKLAIVGTNGAGKTTIVKLICGLFKPTSGRILINGEDAQSFQKNQYYQMFSAVFQDYDIYAGTILENIVGNDTSSEARQLAIACLDRVGLKEKIMSLPKQYDTTLLKVVDPDGVDLSGGQKQKIAIARALYKNGNVIILDEPTSALDALAEAEIYKSFNDLIERKTAIYISHRLSSTKFCDKIAFFDQDGLQEYGSHEELMDLKKSYFHMFQVQGQYYQEEVQKSGN